MIKIDSNIIQKYIVYNKVGEEELSLVGDSGAKWHKEIADNIEEESGSIEVMGGGRIYLDESDKIIYVWDQSTNYGGVKFSVVQSILSKEFADFKLINQLPDVNIINNKYHL